MRDLVIIGVGGFGREVRDIVDAINDEAKTFNLIGFVDDGPSAEDIERVDRLPHKIVGRIEELTAIPASAEYVIGIGTGTTRREIDLRLSETGREAATLVHPTASIGADSTLGPGSIVCAGAMITTNVVLGRHVHVNLGSSIGHDCSLADYVTINPLVAVSGAVSLGPEVLLGTHSSILQGLQVGARAIVGAAACVTRDVPTDVTVKGIPAR